MPVRVYIPTPYRTYTDQQSHVEVDAATVGEVLEALAGRFPALAERILGPDGRAPAHLNVYINQVESRSLQGEGTALRDGDEVALIPAMAGGTETPQGAGMSGQESVPGGSAVPGGSGGAPLSPGSGGRGSASNGASNGTASGPASGPAPAAPLLTEAQMARYSRHVRLDEVGVPGQRRLLDGRVLLIGAGALASPAAIYLAAAGVGTIGIVDGDRVDASNLQRQILHFTADVGLPKVDSARRHLQAINPDVRVVAHETFLSSANALDVLRDYDVIVNGSDNFPTRYLINDACVFLGKPLVDASILKWEGQMTVFLPGRGCYRCLFPVPPPPGSVPSCAEAGIIGAVAGHMGSLQAVEAVKLLLGVGSPLAGRLVLYDAMAGEYQTLRWRRNPACPVCGDSPTIRELVDYEGFCGVPMPGGAHEGEDEVPEVAGWEFEPVEAYRRLQAGAALVDVREPHEFQRVRIPGASLIPLAELDHLMDDVDRTRDAILYCRVGERSAFAVDLLRRNGFSRVYNLRGGILSWINHQLPVEADGAPAPRS